MDRREFVIGAGTLGITALSAGCMSAVFGDGVEATADPATISTDTLDETGFSLASMDEATINEEVSVEGVTRSVTITSWISLFERDDIPSPDAITGEEGNASFNMTVNETTGDVTAAVAPAMTAFTVFSTPSKKIAGTELNPVAQFDKKQMIERVAGKLTSGGISDVSEEESVSVAILNDRIDVKVFSAVVTMNGTEHDVKLYVGDVTHDGDVVLPVGIHHAAVDDRDVVLELLNSVEHPVDPKKTVTETPQ